MINNILAFTIFLPSTVTGKIIRVLAPTEAQLLADPVVARQVAAAG